MAEDTQIAWCDSTFNAWIGCTKISPGCDNCYASVSTPARTRAIVWGPGEERVRTSRSNWAQPRTWNSLAHTFQVMRGRRRRVFCASLSDVFDNEVEEAWRDDLWALVRATPDIDWLILTKRVGNVLRMLPPDWGDGWANVWLGITVVDQVEADRDVPKLLRIPAAVRWLSMEPLLGPVNLRPVLAEATAQIGWVVVGGESGRHARQMDPAWVHQLREQCSALGAAFFFKQWGGTASDKGGALLDGQVVQAWPVKGEPVEA